MIPPTIGRKVWYRPTDFDRTGMHFQEPAEGQEAQPFDATVVYVHHDRAVNIVGYDHNGYQFTRLGVRLLQDDDVAPESGGYCEWMPLWMPFQKGQAKRHEQIPQQEPPQQEPARLTAPEKIS